MASLSCWPWQSCSSLAAAKAVLACSYATCARSYANFARSCVSIARLCVATARQYGLHLAQWYQNDLPAGRGLRGWDRDLSFFVTIAVEPPLSGTRSRAGCFVVYAAGRRRFRNCLTLSAGTRYTRRIFTACRRRRLISTLTVGAVILSSRATSATVSTMGFTVVISSFPKGLETKKPDPARRPSPAPAGWCYVMSPCGLVWIRRTYLRGSWSPPPQADLYTCYRIAARLRRLLRNPIRPRLLPSYQETSLYGHIRTQYLT